MAKHRQELVLASVGLGQLGVSFAQLVFQPLALGEVEAEGNNRRARLGVLAFVEQGDAHEDAQAPAILVAAFKLKGSTHAAAL